MNPPVKLTDLLAALQGSPEVVTFIDRTTGRPIRLEAVLYEAAKSRRPEVEEDSDWRNRELELARSIVADRTKRYVPGPKPADFPEYKTMQNYIAALNDRTIAFDLAQAIKARGAFRQFKQGVTHFGLRDDWLQFRDEALVECARRWAKANRLELDETSMPATTPERPQ